MNLVTFVFKAMSIGAAAVYVDDVRDEFVSEFMNGI